MGGKKKYMNKKTILKTLVIGLLTILVTSSLTPSASSHIKQTNNIKTLSRAGWSDSFDTYANDQFLDGGADDGGWKGWDNVPAAGAYVRDDQYRSQPQSVEIAGDTDLVHEYGYVGGQWTYTAWQFIPDDFQGDSAFILLSDYTDGAGQSNTWVVQLSFNSATGMVESQFNGETLNYITGQWIEIRCEIDLAGDWLKIYYNNLILAEHAYSEGIGNGNVFMVIDAVDLYANSASPVYYDDLSLEGEAPPAADLDCNGALTWTTKTGATVTGDFQVGNIGDAGSLLNWKVDTYPSWGTWTFTPSNGTDLAAGSWVTVDVSVVAPSEKNTFTGKVKIVNIDDPADYCEIDVSITTPRTAASTFIQMILQKFPNAFPILRQLLG
jgi:hypothetical protein